MLKVLYDCDNTMGLPEKDVDDGLTLMYLLGSKDIDLLGVTTTFGNSHIEDVHLATSQLFQDLQLTTQIPLKKGAGKNEDRKSEAAAYLVEMVNQYPQEITLLATGSLTNLYGASLIDPDFFQKVKEVVLMGGLTKPLIINEKNLNELNFSVDHESSYHVLHSGANITTMTGHICLQAEFTKRDYERLIENSEIPAYAYIKDKSIAWFQYFKELFQTEGFFNWDIVSAVYITHPELFINHYGKVISSKEDLKSGFLRINDSLSSGSLLNIPNKITNIERFNDIIFEAWKKVNHP